jgi:hypothetical protein
MANLEFTFLQGKMEVAMCFSVLGFLVSRLGMFFQRNIYAMSMKKSLAEVMKAAPVEVMNDASRG